MCHATKPRKAAKPVTVAWVRRIHHNATDPLSGCLELNGGFYGVVAHVDGEKVVGYRLVKPFSEDSYDVCLDGHGSCECLGYLRWGHCKHLSGLAAALALPVE